MEVIFQLVVLIFSVMVHEISHGAVAFYLGDDTAKKMGRLTLNPLKHIDPIGSIVLPLMLSIPLLFGLKSFIVGWAKPVPYNPFNLKDPKLGSGLIAVAGPLSNLTLAIIFTALLRIAVGFSLGLGIIVAFKLIIFINLLLAIFNLVPIPPLDGSKILFSILPAKYYKIESFLERNGLIFILLFIFIGFSYLGFVVEVLYSLLLTLAGI